MAIAPISSVSFRNNYNQVNFKGRKKDDSHTSSRMSNTLKSIPLATLIAMSPLNATEANAQSTTDANQTKTEKVYHPLKVIAEAVYKNATVDGDSCTLYFASNDGDDSNAEELHLRFDRKGVRTIKGMLDTNNKPKRFYYVSSDYVRVDTLEVVNTTLKYKNRPDKIETRYYVKGEANRTFTQPTAKDGTKLEKAENVYEPAYKKQITKAFFDSLVQTMGDDAVYKTRNEVSDGDAEEEFEILFPGL